MSEIHELEQLWQRVESLEPISRNADATELIHAGGTIPLRIESRSRLISAAGSSDIRWRCLAMADLLLTHGYFLYDDPKELKIMKPYVPLGILYICSHLRKKGFDVEVFDTTFSSLQDLTNHLQTETPSVLGVYANLMTRKKVLEIVRIAREAGWKTIVGGPEPGAYVREYLEWGADVVVLGEGEITMEELLAALRRNSDAELAQGERRRFSRRRRSSPSNALRVSRLQTSTPNRGPRETPSM